MIAGGGRKVSNSNTAATSPPSCSGTGSRHYRSASSSSSTSSTDDDRIRMESTTPPEPSQSIPPQPIVVGTGQQQQPFIMPPWTPWTPNLQQQQQQSKYIGSNGRSKTMIVEDNGMLNDDEESIPSIPDVPSPYSPPPASLFSENEEFPKSIRRSNSKQQHKDALEESYRILHSSNNYRNDSENYSINIANSSNMYNVPSDEKKTRNAITAMNQSQQQYNTMNRQQLLPTVLYLKKDLDDSRTAMHLLQQENKALSIECDHFQKEIQLWKEQYNTSIATKEETISQLRQEIQQMHQETKEMKHSIDKDRIALQVSKEEAERLSGKLQVSDAMNQRLEANNTDLKAELEMKTNELKTLRTTMKEQNQSSIQKLKDTITSYEEKIQSIKEENQSLTIETDRLKAMYHETNQRHTKDIASTKELYHTDLTNIRAKLEEANQTIEDLQRSKTNVEGELQKRNDEIQTLQDQMNTVRSSDTTKQSEVQNLQVTLADALEREEKLRVELESCRKNVTVEQKRMEDEVCRLNEALQNAALDKDAVQTSLTQALETSYTKYSTLRANKEALEKEINVLKTTRKTSSSSKDSPISVHIIERNNELEAEVDQLKVSLSKMSLKCNDLRAEKAALLKKISQQHNNNTKSPREDSTNQQHPKVFKFDQMDVNDNGTNNTNNDDELIPNRLERIRDAAERAALTKEHRREMARLKSEHEKEMKQLSDRQEQDIKDVFEEAKAEVTARSRELRRHLQCEYETKIATLERRYQADLTRMQRECDKNTAVAEEAMQAAASEVSAISEQLDKEVSVRESLKGTIRELEQKLVTEQQKNKLSNNLMISRKQWQRDTNNLLVTIQQECNSVFNQNIIRTGTDSPRSVTIIDTNTTTHKSDNDDNSTSSKDDNSNTSLRLNDSYLSRIADGTVALSTSMSHVAFPIHRTPWKVRPNNTTTSTADGAGVIQKTTSYNSPLDVSQALDETEALVRSLITK